MNTKEMIEELEEILDVEEGSLELSTKLAELEEWDSVSKLSVVIFLDEEFGKKATGDDVAKFETVKDIIEYAQ
ncbi:phosphopantetheine-binding protein [Hominibacterium faecale]|uniref:phosphopantetheine-binding protein n=1 Tax=Hominibacterium faecale TaxID=2839743 RepID=UPI0022B2A15B|nr:phosphopantetheine-binding protein [Hominibacterium faecale]